MLHLAHPGAAPSPDERKRPRRDAEPGDGRLLRRAYRARWICRPWPRLCVLPGSGGVALSQRLRNVGLNGVRVYHRLVSGLVAKLLGGVGPAGRQAAAWRRPLGKAFSTIDSRTSQGWALAAGQNPDPGDDYSVYSETPEGLFRARKGGLSTNESTNHANAGAARAQRPLRWLGDPLLVLGLLSACHSWRTPASHAAGGAELAADAERQILYALRHCAVALGSVPGLRGHAAVALGAADLLCPRRVRHGDATLDYARRRATVCRRLFHFHLSWSELPLVLGGRSIRTGDGARGGAGSPVCCATGHVSAGLHFRSEDQRVLFLDRDPGPEPVRRYAARCLSQRDRVWRATTASPVLLRCWVSGHRHRHPRLSACLWPRFCLCWCRRCGWARGALAPRKFGVILTRLRCVDAEKLG